MSAWPFKHRHAQAVDVAESKQRLAEAVGRRARTRRVSLGVSRAIGQNHFVATFKEVFEEGSGK